MSYFDTSGSVEEAFCQGYWDFAHHILKDDLLPLIGEPFNCSALEIGFGGGRLLNASSRFFNHVYGVDIHENFDKVSEFLASRDVENFTLLKGDGKTIPLEDNSVDFIYSFIVLQHLPTIDILESYLHEVKRILKPGKAACLYIGHLPFNLHGIKYLDINTRKVDTTRENTLLLRPQTTKKLLKKAELHLVASGRPRKKPWRQDLGAQHYVIVTA
nr:class I SAM-dependent methyltransferase [Thalassospira lucentensis]